MYTDEQKRRHIYDLQVCLRRIQQENGTRSRSCRTASGMQRLPLPCANQQQNCLPVTGIADQRTWNAIYGRAYRATMQTASLTHSEQLTARKSMLQLMLGAVRFFPAEGGVRIHSPASGCAAVFQLLQHSRSATWRALTLRKSRSVPPRLANMENCDWKMKMTTKRPRHVSGHFLAEQHTVASEPSKSRTARPHRGYQRQRDRHPS